MNFNVFFCARILWRMEKRPQKRADDTRVHFGDCISRAIKSADAVLRTLSRGYLLYEHTSSLNNRVPKFFAGLRALKSCIVDSISFLRRAERLVVDDASWGVIKSADSDSQREKTQREREKKRESKAEECFLRATKRVRERHERARHESNFAVKWNEKKRKKNW